MGNLLTLFKNFLKNCNKHINIDLLKVAIVCYLAFLMLLGFTGYSSVDQQFAYGKLTSVAVSDLPTNKSKQQIENFIYKTAKENNENIFLEKLDFSKNQNCIQYAFIGNQELYNKYYKNNEYPFFYKQVKVKIESYKKIESHSLTGIYSSTASKSKMKEIVQQWSKFGIKAGWQTEYQTPKTLVFAQFGVLELSDFAFLFIILLFGMIFAVLFSSFTKIKQFAIQISNGFSRKKIVFNELIKIIKDYLICFFVTFICLLIFLFFYNHFNQLFNFLTYLLLTIVLYFLIMICVHIFAITCSILICDLVGEIKGKRSGKKLLIIAGVTQIIIIFLLFSNATTINSDNKVINEYKQNLGSFNSIKNYNSVSYGLKMISNDNFQQPMLDFNKNLEQKNKYLFLLRRKANLGDVQDTNPQNPFAYIPASNSLVVNKKFVELQNIYNSQGNIINSSALSNINSKNWAFVLIPENKRKIETNIIKHVKEFLNDNYSTCAETKKTQPSCSKNKKIKVLWTKVGQQINNYNNGSDLSGFVLPNHTYTTPTFIQRDPIILVVSLKQISKYWGNFGYYDGKVNLEQEFIKYHIQDYIGSINNVYDSVAQKLYELKKQQNNYNFALILAFLILALSATLISMIYCDTNKQVLFAKFSNGYSFFNSMGIFLQTVFTGSIIILSFCVITKQVTGLQNISICLAIILIDLLITIISSKYYYNKMNASFVKRY